MIVPVDSNIEACTVKRETANVRERDLPVEVIWQIPIDLQMSLESVQWSSAVQYNSNPP